MTAQPGDIWTRSREAKRRVRYVAIDSTAEDHVVVRRITLRPQGWVYLPNRRCFIKPEDLKRNWSLYERGGQRQGETNG